MARQRKFDVARAVRTTVKREGQEAPRVLYDGFDEFNAAYFEGKLPPATILLMAPGSPRAWGDHYRVDEHGIRFRIRIAPHLAQYGKRVLRDVLLHEMVHAAQGHFDGDFEKAYRGHGPKFAERCNAIGERLGLAAVAAKGARAGMPECSQWPLNVRPAGYYGAAFTARSRQRQVAATSSRRRAVARLVTLVGDLGVRDLARVATALKSRLAELKPETA